MVNLTMLKIPKAVFEAMVEHAKTCYPQEACGFLCGTAGAASAFIPVENMEHSSISYSMDPKQQLRAFNKMREEKTELLGIVHSHVASSPLPSQKDLALAVYPDVGYVIISLADMKKPDVKAWNIMEGKHTPMELKVS